MALSIWRTMAAIMFRKQDTRQGTKQNIIVRSRRLAISSEYPGQSFADILKEYIQKGSGEHAQK